MWRALYVIYACVVLIVTVSVVYRGDNNARMSGSGYRSGSTGGGWSGGSGHK
jgi:uncharacterized membrane protein YgcG